MTSIFKIDVSQVRNELRRRKAVKYLRERRMYRGDLNCAHRYEPHDPQALRDDTRIQVTVCRSMAHVTVNHAMRG